MTSSLAKCVRITKASDYADIFQNGTHSQSKYWKLIVNDSGNSSSRLGLAISKKIFKRAVDRNLFKRLARETFRKSRIELKALDFIIMVKKTVTINNALITKDLLKLMKDTNSRTKIQ